MLALPVGGLLILSWIDGAPLAATRLSARLGRAVTLGGLHVPPEWPFTVELHDRAITSMDGGATPGMARLARLTAPVEPLSD